MSIDSRLIELRETQTGVKNMTASTLTKEQEQALQKVPSCVELDDMDGTWEHVVYRVEHPVILRMEGEDFYSKREAISCCKWLEKFAPESKYAKAKFQ
jgi:hypothetical protein